MKRQCIRALCLFMAVMLLPLSSLAEGYDTEPLYRSTFKLGFALDPQAFPKDGALHYSDWQHFLETAKIVGTIDYQRPDQPDDQYVVMNADLQFDGESYFPFCYESIGYSRYFTVKNYPYFKLSFNMLNFWEFMAKPFIFMELPTNLLSIGMYWEESLWVIQSFLEPLRATTEGKKSLSYEEVMELAQSMSDMISGDQFNRYYYFLFGLLGLIYGNSLVYDDLCYLPDWVDMLDPVKKGLTILSSAEGKTYQLGDTVILTTKGENWHLNLPDPNGYVFDLEWTKENGNAHLSAKAVLDEDERLNAQINLTGLPDEQTLENEGDLTVSITGSVLPDALDIEEFSAKIHFRHTRSSLLLPRNETLTLDWIHPESNKAAVSMTYEAVIEEIPASELVEIEPYDGNSLYTVDEYTYYRSDDFFSLNDQKLLVYKEYFVKPVLITLIPMLFHVPIGVYSDVFAFLEDTGFLAMLGFEGAQ